MAVILCRPPCCLTVRINLVFVDKYDNSVRQLRADSSFAPSQWETSSQSNAVSHWLGAKLETALRLASCMAFLWRVYENGARTRYLRQGEVIAPHRILWFGITYPCLRYLLLAPKSSYMNTSSNLVRIFEITPGFVHTYDINLIARKSDS